jgi:hypothetical protein
VDFALITVSRSYAAQAYESRSRHFEGSVVMRDPRFSAWIDRARAVPIEREIDRRGVKLKRVGAEHVGPCPKCDGEDRFAINPAKGVWNCRGCDTGGDVIKLVEHLDGVDFMHACEALAGEPPPKFHRIFLSR